MFNYFAKLIPNELHNKHRRLAIGQDGYTIIGILTEKDIFCLGFYDSVCTFKSSRPSVLTM